MPVYNEVRFIENTIISVLNQSYHDFKLIISDNHSTDGTDEIIKKYKAIDSRIAPISPPRFLSSIEHVDHLQNNILINENFNKYTIFIGGHDIWEKNLLSCLFDSAEQNPNASIVYTDTLELDHNNNITKKYNDAIQTVDISRPFIPHHILIGLTHNIIIGGLMRENIRRKIQFRHKCSAIDHFLVAEMALEGSILYQQGSYIYLRIAPDFQSGFKYYCEKHIPLHIRKIPILDFINQLEWAASLLERAVIGNEFCSNPLIYKMLKNSLLSAYICRYWPHLTGINNAYESFFNNKEVNLILNLNNECSNIFDLLISSIHNNNNVN
jgi:glycosyltransferase involved in cell wall biosynthesis